MPLRIDSLRATHDAALIAACGPQKITFGDMRDSGVCGVLVYCADYRCSHSVALSADRWPDDVVRYRAAVRLRCLRQTGCGGPAGFRLEYDPHNQELAQCLLEDYAKNRSFDRDRLLLACAQHTAVHRKYGDFLECGRRYGAGHGRCRSGLPRTTSCNEQRRHHCRFRWRRDAEPKPATGSPANLQS